MWKYIIAVGIIILLVAIYILSYIWDKNTKKPEDCEDLECTSCKSADCTHRKES